jgi:multiple sugar transport system substrate-binding protein
MVHSRKILSQPRRVALGIAIAALVLAGCSSSKSAASSSTSSAAAPTTSSGASSAAAAPSSASGGGASSPAAPASSAGGGAAITSPVTLNILSPWSGTSPFAKPLSEVAAAFQAANPNVTVKINPVAVAQVAPVFESTTLAGDPADIIITNPIQDALKWVEQGATVPVSQYMTDWGLEGDLLPGAQADPSWKTDDGQFRGFPFQSFIWPTWYDKTALASVGVTTAPATADQQTALNTALKAKGSKPLYTVGGLDWSGENTFFQIVQTDVSDPDMLKASQTGNWGDYPGVLKGIQYFVSMRDAGMYSSASKGQTVDQMTADFYAQHAAGATLVSDFFAAAPASLQSNVILSGIPVPAGFVHTKPVVMAGYNSYGFMISKKASTNSAKLAAIEAFMKYIYQPAEVGKFVTEAAMPPALKATEDAATTNPMLLQVTSQAWLDSVDIVTPTEIPANVASNLTTVLAQAWVPGTSAQTILKSMEDAYKQ